MNALFAVKDAMDKNVSYKALIAEKEHLDANIADALNKIQSYREETTEWSEIDNVTTRIAKMRDWVSNLENNKNPEDIPHDTIMSIQNSIETAREYRDIVIRDLERKVHFLGEYHLLDNYKKDIAHVKKALWDNYGINVK